MGRVILFALALCMLTSTAWAGIYTFQSNDGSGVPNDFNGLDHNMAYLWAFTWKPVTGEVITGAQLSFSNIYNNDNSPNWLGVYLIADKPTTGGTTGWSQWSTDTFSDATPDSAVYQKSDSQNVGRPFDTVATKDLLGAYSDTRSGSTIKDSPVFDFAAPALKSASAPTWGWSIYDDAPLDASALDEFNAWVTDGNWALGIDPDCHFYNCGVTLTITTGKVPPGVPTIPEPMSCMLGLMGLVSVAGLRRFRRA